MEQEIQNLVTALSLTHDFAEDKENKPEFDKVKSVSPKLGSH